MKSILTLPLAAVAGDTAYFLELKKDGLLHISCAQAADPTEQVILTAECNRFTAATDREGRLHVLTAGDGPRPVYYCLQAGQVETIPFPARAAETFFLAFGSGGHGYYIGQNKAGITLAVNHDMQKWSFHDYELGTSLLPAGLAVDSASYAHLLLCDAAEGKLLYQTADPKQYRLSSPLQLATGLQLQTPPVLLFDAVQNIHLTWISAADGQLHYRVRLAGGWPVGGWQQEFSRPLTEKAELLALTEAYPHPQIWVVTASGHARCFHAAGTEEEKVCRLSPTLLLLRKARTGACDICLFRREEGIPLLTQLLIEKKEAQSSAAKAAEEEEDNPFFLHARRLLTEKKRLELEINKKDASLAQLQRMLEMSQENVRKQSRLLNDRLEEIQAKMGELRQKNSRLEAKIQELQDCPDRLQHAEKALQKAEKIIADYKQQMTELQNELTLANRREKDYLRQLGKLQAEIDAKKGLWESFAGLFQKKPSVKK
ncbi:MAG: hypothetical protein GX167_09790 [Firmicutes bacterium]|nr:hypothetical protein [Bacillota bacterium]